MDKLEFRIVRASELKEEWILDEYEDNPDKIVQMQLVKIFVNEQDLKDIVTTIEKPYMVKSGWREEDADYGHNTVEYMQYQFAQLSDKNSYCSKHGIELFCCLDCGIAGCWSVICQFRAEGDKVFMENFHHNHRDWEYNLSYCFSKENFETEILKLK